MSRTRYIFLSILFLAGLCWSCSMEENLEPVIPEVPELGELPDSVYFILGEPKPLTRVTYSDGIHSDFEKEDLVGCFALNEDLTPCSPEDGYKSNACYRVAVYTDLRHGDDRRFLAPMEESDDIKHDADKYLFYYPYDPDMTIGKLSAYTHSVLPDQNQREKYEASDLLWDICVPNREKQCVEVYMDHAMSNIIVEVDPDLIDEGTVPTLLNLPVTVSPINLLKDGLDEMEESLAEDGQYVVEYSDDACSDITMWEFGMANSGNYMFRAIVPANQLLIPGTTIIKITKDGEEKRYKLTMNMSPLDLLPGRNYYLHIVEKYDYVAPDIEDDDTWVYDVLDPETLAPVGLLCKEYLYFQPGHSLTDADSPTGTLYNSGESKFISSQAWVLYINEDGIPDLNTGYVLKFVNDVRQSGESGICGYWPEPHYNVGTGGLFTPSHGHTWVYSSEKCCGEDSSDWTEHYMHGGVITWDGVNNKISWFELPDDLVTNEVAATQGHVAIGDDDVPFLCYDEIGSAGHKIALLSPHNLIDRRVSITRSVDERIYPLVKIGYNQFWMAYELRTNTQIDGTPVTNYNTVGSPGISLPADVKDINPGYLFINRGLSPMQDSNEERTETFVIDGVTHTFSYYDPFNQFPTVEEREKLKIAPMYNFLVHEGSGMLPLSIFTGGHYYMPTRADFLSLVKYLGWNWGAKLMTSDVRIRGNGVEETVYEALMAGKYINFNDANRYAANICGFDLRAEGYRYDGAFRRIGTAGSVSMREGENNYIFSLPYYLVYNPAQSVDDLLSNTDMFIPTHDNANQGPGVTFAPLRFFLKFEGQADTGGLVISSLSTGTKSAPAASRDVYVGVEPLE